MNKIAVVQELVKLAKELVADQFDHPKMDDALAAMKAASPKLLRWLNTNSKLRLSGWTATYSTSGAGKVNSLYAGLGALQEFYVQEEKIRGGGFWKVQVIANVDGEVVVQSSMPNDRTMTDGTFQWSDLDNPEKIFSKSRLPRKDSGRSYR